MWNDCGGLGDDAILSWIHHSGAKEKRVEASAERINHGPRFSRNVPHQIAFLLFLLFNTDLSIQCPLV